jgi:hypothetical protein
MCLTVSCDYLARVADPENPWPGGKEEEPKLSALGQEK